MKKYTILSIILFIISTSTLYVNFALAVEVAGIKAVAKWSLEDKEQRMPSFANYMNTCPFYYNIYTSTVCIEENVEGELKNILLSAREKQLDKMFQNPFA
jgi:hypothetical protein